VVQEGFYRELAFVAAGGHHALLRQAVESFAGNPSWNTGIEYPRLFESAEPSARDAVEALYAKADLDLDRDLERIDTGHWPPTSPEAMNRRGRSLGAGDTRFVDYDPGPGYRPSSPTRNTPGLT
jgi:hypothetical protein